MFKWQLFSDSGEYFPRDLQITRWNGAQNNFTFREELASLVTERSDLDRIFVRTQYFDK